MHTRVPGVQSFSDFLHYFVVAKLATRSIRVKLRILSSSVLSPLLDSLLINSIDGSRITGMVKRQE